MPLTISIDDLLRWNDASAQHWQNFATAHPALLELPCDIRASGTVAVLLKHVVAVELRYAERLCDEPETPYEALPSDPTAALFATHQHAMHKLRALLAEDRFDWDQHLTFTTMSAGRLEASRRDVLLHLLLHSMRHYAQLATLVRSHGFKPDWPMDFLFLNAKPAASDS